MKLDHILAGIALCATAASAIITGSRQCNSVLCVTGTHDSETKMDTCEQLRCAGSAS